MTDRPRRLLFTPGPLTTRESVRAAMMTDIGSREPAFINAIRKVRRGLLAVAGVDDQDFAAVPVQGSGTFAIEAALSSLIPAGSRLLVLVNGAYGKRIAAIAGRLGIETESQSGAETEPPDIDALRRRLAGKPAVAHVAAVHCETTTGLLNPVAEIGAAVAASGATFLVDAMSSFGGIPIDFESCHVDALISSPNKCLESVPGLAFVIARRALLENARGVARGVCLDLHGQWETLERTGQFRFTPPTQVILALARALEELRDEGGPTARHQRYRDLHARLLAGMRELGFREVLPPALQSPVITAFHRPRDPAWEFDDFSRRLDDLGLVLYPGKLSEIDSFRVGTIGALTSADIGRLLAGIRATLGAMKLPVPLD